MEGVEKEENHTDNSCPHFYLYVPGKLKTDLYNEMFTSNVALPEKNTLDLTSCNSSSHAPLSRPINLFSGEFRKIDTDLKKMHRIWSNID